jgi:hypothetical protein
VVEPAKNQLLRDFRRRSVFDFCNTIRRKADFIRIALRSKNDPKLKFVDRYPHHGSRTFAAPAKLGRSAAAAVRA